MFQYSVTPSGIPLLPVTSKRISWWTFLRFNLDAWAEAHPLIAVSSDILNVENPLNLLSGLHHARIIGSAKYKSPKFGWLPEEKNAVLIQLGKEDTLDEATLAEVVESCCLIDEEYQGDSVAFMIENGEKEYSLEVAAIRESEVKVLWRYTVGGNNSVFRCFEPELISINYK